MDEPSGSESAQWGPRSLLRRICDACLGQTTANAIAVAVVNAAGHRGTAYASSDVAASVEDAGFVLGQGPCVDAFAAHGPVLVNDLGLHEFRARWAASVKAGQRARNS